jgi:DNA-binding Lrp family transcriptional regulator
MKTVVVLGDRASELLLDALNQRIVRELVFSEHSVTELSRRLNTSHLKVWRRVQKLVDVKVLEVVRIEVVRNLEKKVYRAAATNFVSKQLLDLKPSDANLGNAFEVYLEIQRRILGRVSSFSDIPVGANPIDFSIYVTVKSFCEVLLDPGTGSKLRRIREEISAFEKDQRGERVPKP